MHIEMGRGKRLSPAIEPVCCELAQIKYNTCTGEALL